MSKSWLYMLIQVEAYIGLVENVSCLHNCIYPHAQYMNSGRKSQEKNKFSSIGTSIKGTGDFCPFLWAERKT